jgi:hypothetical protein
MHTLGSTAAFTKVVHARNELCRIAEELNAARQDMDASPESKAKFIELRKRRNHARQEFGLAINVFSATRNHRSVV